MIEDFFSKGLYTHTGNAVHDRDVGSLHGADKVIEFVFFLKESNSFLLLSLCGQIDDRYAEIIVSIHPK